MAAESALTRHQLLILPRGSKRARNLRTKEHIAAGLFTPFINPTRNLRSGIILNPTQQ